MLNGRVAIYLVSIFLVALSLLGTLNGAQAAEQPSYSPQSLINWSTVPSTGTARVLVVPVDFPDRLPTRSFDYLQDLFFTKLADYWRTVSYGRLTIQGTVVRQWFQLTGTYASYAAATDDASAMLNDALTAASSVKFSGYNVVVFVHAGNDNAGTWNGSWDTADLEDFASTGAATLPSPHEGVTVGVEFVAENDEVGPIAHWMGITFGLPNLWDLAVLKSKCPYCDDYVGEFDLMAHGFWANNGTTPAEPSAWTRIKLGWIDQSQIVTVTSGQQEATLNLLESGNGTLAVKVPLTAQTYYLVEARKRVSYDLYLPDEGVLIYYVDDTKGLNGAQDGPVRLKPSNGTNVNTAGQIAWRQGESFVDKQNGVLIYVKSGEPGDSLFTLVVAKGFVRTDAGSTEQLTVHLPYANMTVKVDDQSDSTEKANITIPLSLGAHELWVQPTVPIGEGVRAVFSGWSDGDTNNPRLIIVMNDSELTAQYDLQYMLTVNSVVPVNFGGWYDANSTVALSANATADLGNRTRYVFTSWSNSVNGQGNTQTLIMDGPKTVDVNWTRQYEVTVLSSYGAPEGDGWYDEGSIATISVMSPFDTGEGTRQLFIGWSGDASGTDPGTQVTVNAPKTVSAQWKPQDLVFLLPTDSNESLVTDPTPTIQLRGPDGSTRLQPISEGNWLTAGNYTLESATWHSVEVATPGMSFFTQPNAKWVIPLDVHELTVNVIGMPFWLPASGATVTVRLPDGTNKTAAVRGGGYATIQQLPQGNYVLLTDYQFLQWTTQIKLASTTTLMIGIPSLFQLAFISVALGAAGIIARKHKRKSRRKSFQKTVAVDVAECGDPISLVSHGMVCDYVERN
jgi:M6 family metalloprotease-like protein